MMMMMMMMMIHVPRCQKACKTGPVCKSRKASRSISHEGDAHPISHRACSDFCCMLSKACGRLPWNKRSSWTLIREAQDHSTPAFLGVVPANEQASHKRFSRCQVSKGPLETYLLEDFRGARSRRAPSRRIFLRIESDVFKTPTTVTPTQKTILETK